MTTETTNGFTTLFETGEGDGRWSIEEDADGLLCVSSNAETRRVIAPDSYLGWNADQFRADLIRDGVSEDLADRVIEQAGL